MLPTKLTAVDPEAVRALYKVVRRDTLMDVSPGSLILSACEETGLCLVRLSNGASQEFNLLPGGLRILPR